LIDATAAAGILCNKLTIAHTWITGGLLVNTCTCGNDCYSDHSLQFLWLHSQSYSCLFDHFYSR